MKNTLKKLLVLSGLVICATSSFASPVNVTNNINNPTHQQDGAMFSNDDEFAIQYRNNSNSTFYYDNDRGGVKDGRIDEDRWHYIGHGALKLHDKANFTVQLHTALTTKGAKRMVYLYIPITSGQNSGKYKQVAFMVWTPHSGNPSWKLGTSNPDNPMDEDAYDYYNFHYEIYSGENDGPFVGTKSWGLVDIQLEQGGGSPYLKIDTYYSFDPFSSMGSSKIANSQIIDTDRVQGKIVTLDDIQNKPQGSYRNSCRDAAGVRGWEHQSKTLKQECQNSEGKYNFISTLDYSSCAKDSTVSNNNGNLTCDQKRDSQMMTTSVKVDAPKGSYDFGQWKAGEYPVIYSPKEIHPFVTYNGKGYVACNGDTTAKDVPGKSDAWKEINGSLGNTCGYTVHSYKKQSTTPSVTKSAVSFW